MFRAYGIAEDIFWVGALEWNERVIHGCTMPEGSTNNAYLILDEHPTLIDTCIDSHADEMLERIASVIDPSRIEYVISNHSEKDHAGSIAKVLEKAADATVITSVKGHPILETYYGNDRAYMPVKTGDELCIGKRTLRFVQTPMVHWPDNMVTYDATDRILFSNDAFGQFIATSKRFDDEVDVEEIYRYARKYFANILTPYLKQTAKAVAAVKELELEMVAPAHGIIWRSHIDGIIEHYEQWCDPTVQRKAIVAYSTMYGSTERMALTITEAFMAQGVEVRMYDLDISDMSDIISDLLDAEYLCIGSPTHNSTVLPPAGAFLTYVKGLAPKGRIGIAFGSYGWAAAGQKEIADVLASAGFTLPMEPIEEAWNDTPADDEDLFARITALVSEDA